MNSRLIVRENESDAIAWISLNRPEKRNALNMEAFQELCRTIEEIERQPGTRVLILKGMGPVFCSGLDLKEAADAELVERSAQLLAATLRRVWNSTLVTVAAVHGAAIAGGAGLAAACDYVISSDSAIWAFPEVKRGLVPALISAVLIKQTNRRTLLDWLLTGREVPVQELRAAGVINQIVDSNEVIPAARELAQSLLAGAPGVQRKTKRLLDKLSGRSLDDLIDLALADHLESRSSEEAREGVRAYFEKRQPAWNVVET
ncbi:MAG TPA: enoyl-CoA hydratase-related protein [Acidobacteriota bacterium]|nr:enoyl-CoA hydratase-related protein [Acidobacteriota bacterium]